MSISVRIDNTPAARIQSPPHSHTGYNHKELNLPSKLGLRGEILSEGDSDTGAFPFDDDEGVEEELELAPAKGLE